MDRTAKRHEETGGHMSAKNLQELLDSTGNTVELLRYSQLGAYLYPVVPSEVSNVRRETIAWRETLWRPSAPTVSSARISN